MYDNKIYIVYYVVKVVFGERNFQMANDLKPLLKYPGGKSSEWETIKKYLPNSFNKYIEPFVGGGAVFFHLNNYYSFINDKSEELMLLYEYVKNGNSTFFDELNIIIGNWDRLGEVALDDRICNLYIQYREDENIDMLPELSQIVNTKIDEVPMFNLRSAIKFETFLVKCLSSKFKLIRKNEIKKNEKLDNQRLKDNIEAGIKASYYTYLRDVYNKPVEYNNLSKPRKVAIYLFIREYCFSSMFRFNGNGEFNVPYGGLSYNKKTLQQKKVYYKNGKLKKLLKNTELFNEDFYDFLQMIEIDGEDFMFLDPPYDTTFSEYDQNSFDENDQQRLANYLINNCPCKFMLIIKKTEYIYNLYRDRGLNIIEEDKNYFVSFKNRNKKKVKHLIITNY